MKIMANTQNLSNAIILKAVDDYRTALKNIKKNQNDGEAKSRKAEVERFFRSSWFGSLTNIDPETLIRELREESENS